MTIQQLIDFYENKKDVPCPVTEALIKSGYQQRSGGYISYAIEEGIEVDYRKALPTQWWHLIKSYCYRTPRTDKFTKRIRCGELYFWMAEVSGAFTNEELEELMYNVLSMCPEKKRRKATTPTRDTAAGNEVIRDHCFDRIKELIDTQ